MTYTDVDGTRYFRHSPEPVRSFEAAIDIGGSANGLVLGTPNGQHEIGIEIRAHREGRMEPVLRVRGEAAEDGRLRLTVTDVLTGETRAVDL